jgi:hypothetical protein
VCGVGAEVAPCNGNGMVGFGDWWFLGMWEMRENEEVRRRAGMRRRKEEGHLKRGHVRDLNRVHSIALEQVCVCEVGLYARTNANQFECRLVSTIERIVVRSIAQCTKFFFLQKYLQIQIYSTPKLKMSHCPQM